jgi:hypothetical protein
LDVLEIDAPVLHDVGMDPLAMPSGLLSPGGDGALVASEGSDDGLRWAACGGPPWVSKHGTVVTTS